MIATASSFPFNMGWWGFIFPVGELRVQMLTGMKKRAETASGIFTLLTISIGEEFDFRFFKVLSCVRCDLDIKAVLSRLTSPRFWQEDVFSCGLESQGEQ
jgi:hypothetical protein